MKKIISYLIIFTLIVIMPINIKALTGSISIKCDKEDYSMNETATCKVTGTSDEEVRSVSAKVNSEYLNVSFTADSIWQGNGDNGNIQLYSDSAKKGTFNIGTLKVTVKDSDSTEVSGVLGILTLSDVKYSDVSIEGLQTQILFTNSGNNSGNNSSNNSNGTSSGSNTGSLSNTSSTSNNPQTSDFKVGLIVCLIVMTLIISVLGYKKLKKLLRN